MNMAKNRKRGEPISIDWIASKCIVTDTGCWEWQGARQPNGYGKTWYNDRHVGAHCAAFELSKGAVPPGLCVLHECDNRPCCNPEHLFAGTNLDNTQDMIQKGRFACGVGEKHGISKLTDEQVLAIRSSSESGRAKAKAYGVSPATISRVMTGKCWSHLSPM